MFVVRKCGVNAFLKMFFDVLVCVKTMFVCLL